MTDEDGQGYAQGGQGLPGMLVRLDERSREHGRRLTTLETTCVTKTQFAPIEKLVYGVTAAILLAVVGALLRMAVVS